MAAPVLAHPTLVETSARADRAAQARAILARAEERTGTTRWSREPERPAGTAVEMVVPDEDAGVPGVPTIASVAETADPVVDRLDVPSVGPASDRSLPVDGRLAGLLPSGALDRGTTLVVSGSTSLLLGLVAEASRAGSWAAVVGMPAVGVLAAAQLGLDLDRLVLVPTPGPDAALVVGALLDGMDLVVVGPQAALVDVDRRRLSARARERSRVLLSTAPWPGASVVLTAGTSRWEGLDRGHGRLRSRLLWVQRDGRGAAARGRRVEVMVPLARRAG